MSEDFQEHDFQEHDHDFLAHSHRHYHVTHNWSGSGFDHLSSEHEHEHDHSAIRHAHVPHENFASEHQGEAHIHDHEHALRRVEPLEPVGAGENTVTGAKVAKSTAAPLVGTEAGRRVGKVARDGDGKSGAKRAPRRTATRTTP